MDTLIQQTMTALLSDPDTKRKVLDYLQALTDKERPAEALREVYWCISDETRYNPDEQDRETLVKGVRRALYLMVYYNSVECVGMIRAREIPGQFAGLQSRGWPYDDTRLLGVDWRDKDVVREVISADDYTTAIRYALEHWPRWLQEWLSSPIEVEDHNG